MASREQQRRDNLGRFIRLQDEDSRDSDSSLEAQFRIFNLDEAPVPLIVRTMTTLYNLNPYDGNINPSSTDGQKLFLKATQSLDKEKQIKVTQSNVQKIMDIFSADARKFGWAALVDVVPTTATGNPMSILQNFTELTLDHVKKQARETWGDRAANFDDDVPAIP